MRKDEECTAKGRPLEQTFFLTLTLPLVLVTWQLPSPGLQNGAQRGQSQSVVQEPGGEAPVSAQLSPDHTGSYHSAITTFSIQIDMMDISDLRSTVTYWTIFQLYESPSLLLSLSTKPIKTAVRGANAAVAVSVA